MQYRLSAMFYDNRHERPWAEHRLTFHTGNAEGLFPACAKHHRLCDEWLARSVPDGGVL
jgi:hypothetical protein